MHCVKSVQIGFFWSVFSCIRTRKTSVTGNFSHSAEVVDLPLNVMIIRVCFIEVVENRNDIHKWFLFIVPDTTVSPPEISKSHGHSVNKLKSHGHSVNKPKLHRYSVKAMNILSIILKVTKLATHLDDKFMLLSHMKTLEEDIMSSVSRCICKYDDYLKAQRTSNSRLRDNEDLHDNLVETFSVRIIQQFYDNKLYMKNSSVLKTNLESTDAYVPININNYVNYEQRQSAYGMVRSIREVGFPTISGDFGIFYFCLPSQGPQSSVNVLLKPIKDSSSNEAENTKVVVSLRGTKKYFYSRASRRATKKTLHAIGIIRFYKAEYLLCTRLGGASAPNDLTEASIL